MIELRGLTKRYGPTLAVDDLSFQVQPGKVTGSLAPTAPGNPLPCGVIGRARLVADAPIGQVIAGSSHTVARVRTPVAAQLGHLLAPTAQTVRQESDPLLTVVGLTTAVAVLFAPPILGALVSNEIVATLLAWAVGALAVRVITLHRRDP